MMNNNTKSAYNAVDGANFIKEIAHDIPSFPDDTDISINDKDLFEKIFNEHPPQISEFTFTNFFAWQHAYDFRLCKIHDNYLVRGIFHGKTHFLEPLIAVENGDIFVEVLTHYRALKPDIDFIRISESTANILMSDPRLKVEEDRDNFDYVYLRETMATLPGRHFDGKRNFVKRALQLEPEIQPITRELIEPCRDLLGKWREDKVAGGMSEYDKMDYEATSIMLDNFARLSVFGMAVLLDGKVEAFAIGEKLNESTTVTHVEKANKNITGLYQMINFVFCRDFLGDFTFINREQDLGLPGLRKAKLSYHPVQMIKKFRVTLS